MFTQILSALHLSTPRRHMVLSEFESSGMEKTLLHLQNVTVSLFGVYGTQHQETFVTNGGGDDYDCSESSGGGALSSQA